MRDRASSAGLTLVEMMAVLLVGVVLVFLVWRAGWTVYARSSLAVSANNIRLLAAAAAQYLAEHNNRYWKFRVDTDEGTTFWFGWERRSSMARREGDREYDPSQGPLAGYIPAGMRPDPSFAVGANAFKPKYRSGYIGVGYNGVLGGGFRRTSEPLSYWELSDPSKVVVFATSAQVNTFQSPASPAHPMLEEFYLIDDRETTVHFRHGKMAMVAFATGSAGFLPMDPLTRDNRMPKANVGRFAPRGSTKYLR